MEGVKTESGLNEETKKKLTALFESSIEVYFKKTYLAEAVQPESKEKKVTPKFTVRIRNTQVVKNKLNVDFNAATKLDLSMGVKSKLNFLKLGKLDDKANIVGFDKMSFTLYPSFSTFSALNGGPVVLTRDSRVDKNK